MPRLELVMQDRRIVLALGDSLTQQGYRVELNGWVAGLSNAYERLADVYNRGYSGYNTELIRSALPSLLDSVPRAADLAVICLGANDAALPEAGTNQDVSMDKFQANLTAIITDVRKTGTSAIVLMTPPNVDPTRESARIPSRTSQYAKAVGEIGAFFSLPVVPLFDLIEPEHLRDGLHFNAIGNQIALDALLDRIQNSYPNLHPSNLSLDLPYWKDLLKPEESGM